MRYGPYETIEPPLGQGGMGVVYRARHTVLGTSACVKLLLPEYTRNPHVVERFINEARAAAQLDHEHVVAVLDCNQTPDGAWYIVLEYLEGVPLSKWLRGKVDHGVAPRIQTSDGTGATDLLQIARILLPVAGALHAAHEAGIVHRDVKPDNIMLVVRRSGGEENRLHPVLLDFGIAKMRADHGAGLTRSGAFLGTMAYMAPEQFGSAKFADRRTDVYALGAVLYQMVTGGFYAWGDPDNKVGSTEQLYYRQVTEPPPDPRARNPAVSPALAELVRWALTCDPHHRCPSALAFGQTLVRIIEAEGKTHGDDFLRTWRPAPTRRAAPTAATASEGSEADLSQESTWRPPASAMSSGIPSEIVGRPDEATRRVRPPPLDEAGTSLDPAGEEATPAAVAPVAPVAVVLTPVMVAPESPRGLAVASARPSPAGPWRWLAPLVAVGAVALAVAAIVVMTSGGGGGAGAAVGSSATTGRVADGGGAAAATNAPGSAPAVAPSIDAAARVSPSPAATVSLAILTEPTGAAVFVDDELVGTSPTKAPLVPGRSVRIRAELTGRPPTELTHVVADRPDTVHLNLAPTLTTRDRGSRGPGTRSGSGDRTEVGARPTGGSGSGSAARTFDPEHLGQ